MDLQLGAAYFPIQLQALIRDGWNDEQCIENVGMEWWTMYRERRDGMMNNV